MHVLPTSSRTAAAVRHQTWPLRLGPPGTDAVVPSRWIVCTHFDAFCYVTDPRAARIAA